MSAFAEALFILVKNLALAAIAVLWAIAQAPHLKAQSPPALPFYDWTACPFEGCSYGQWTARGEIVVYNTWKEGRQPIARLFKRDKVLGVTGVVITFKPGIIRIDRALPDLDLKRGDTILTYAYRGEGVSAVWSKGRYLSEFDIAFTKWPDGGGCGGAHCAATYIDLGEKVWWAQVKLRSGRVGWVTMDNVQFDGVSLICSLGP